MPKKIDFMPEAAAAPKINFTPEAKSAEPSEPVSAKESFARGTAQGSSLSFGDELSANQEAFFGAAEGLITGKNAFGDEGRLSGITNYIDNYARARDTHRQQNKEAEEANEGTYLLGKIAGAVPLAVATGGESVLANAASGGAMAAATSIGEGEGRSTLEAADDATKSFGTGMALTGLLGGTIKILGKVGSAMIKGPKGAFKISEEMGESLANPKVAEKVGLELGEVGTRLADVSQKSRASVGTQLQSIADKTNKTINLKPGFEDTIEALNKFNPGRDATAQAVKNDFIDTLQSLGGDLAKPSDPFLAGPKATGDLSEVTFKRLHEVKQELGRKIFEQGLFAGNKFVDKTAKNFYHKIAGMLKSADDTGQYDTLSDVYNALSSSDPESFTANGLKYLQDPWDLGSMGKMNKLLGKLRNLDPKVKEATIPELASFIDNDLTQAAYKAEILKKVGGKSGTFFMKGAPLPSPSSIGADVGAEYSQALPQALRSGIESGMSFAAPKVGAIAGGAGRAAIGQVSPNIASQIERGLGGQ